MSLLLDAPPDLDVALEGFGLADVPVTSADVEQAGGPDPHHRDPFDRIL
jgi:PIN domain nuclease of toxin-antitoxin system